MFSVNFGWLFNWVYTLEPISVWKFPKEIPFALVNITNLIFAFLLALVYALIYKGLPCKGVVKGLWFGLFVWLVGALPGNFALGMFTVIVPGVIIYGMEFQSSPHPLPLPKGERVGVRG